MNLWSAFMALAWWEMVMLVVVLYLIIGFQSAVCYVRKDTPIGNFSAVFFAWPLALALQWYEVNGYFEAREHYLRKKSAERLARRAAVKRLQADKLQARANNMK